jgi:hypothetical protein
MPKESFRQITVGRSARSLLLVLGYTLEGLPAGFTIEDNGTIFGSFGPGVVSGSPYHVTVTATDGLFRSKEIARCSVRRLLAAMKTPQKNKPRQPRQAILVGIGESLNSLSGGPAPISD